MRRKIALAVPVVALAAVAAWWAASQRSMHEPVLPDAPASGEQGAVRTPAPSATPQARAFRERQSFEREIKRFFADTDRLGAVTRGERARAYSARIDAYERDAQMSAGEAFLLRAALIDATAVDEEDRARRLADLAARYRADATRREAAWAANLARNPSFRDYKAQEEAIVAEVSAMTAIPDGLTHDEYLRRRLQQARENAYR